VLDRNHLAWIGGADPGVRNLPRLSTVREDTESSPVGSYLCRFGQFVLDPRRRTLSRADSPVFLTPKAFDVLIFLVRNPNRLVTKEELLQSVWGDTFVEEGNLAQYISHFSDPERAFLYPIAYYALGRKKESDAALSELIAKYHANNAYWIAQVYAFRNQSDEAFEWLDRAYAQRDSGLIGTKVDPLLKNLHNDPRYTAFLKKIHLST
jgi:hypothetical protein